MRHLRLLAALGLAAVLTGCGKPAPRPPGGDAGAGPTDISKTTAEDHAAAKALVETGNRHLKQKELEQALDCYERAIVKDEGNARAYYGRGRIRVLQSVPKEKDKDVNWGLVDSAVEDFARAIELEPKHARSYLRRGQAYLQRGISLTFDSANADQSRKDLADALADLNKTIELSPRDPEAYLGRGRVHQAYEEYEAAIADYERTLQLSSKYADARKFREECRRRQRAAASSIFPDLAENEEGNAEDE